MAERLLGMLLTAGESEYSRSAGAERGRVLRRLLLSLHTALRAVAADSTEGTACGSVAVLRRRPVLALVYVWASSTVLHQCLGPDDDPPDEDCLAYYYDTQASSLGTTPAESILRMTAAVSGPRAALVRRLAALYPAGEESAEGLWRAAAHLEEHTDTAAAEGDDDSAALVLYRAVKRELILRPLDQDGRSVRGVLRAVGPGGRASLLPAAVSCASVDLLDPRGGADRQALVSLLACCVLAVS